MKSIVLMLMSKLGFIGLAAFALAVVVGSQIGLFQWDTEAYHAAGRAWWQGGDPYDVLLLTNATGKQPLPFVYPPHLLPLTGAFALVPLSIFHLLFVLAKMGGLFLLFRCWRRVAGPETEISPGFALLAFHGALILDLGAGNVAVFETLLLWLALEAWIDRRAVVFAIGTVVAAQIKLLPGAFLALGILEPPFRRKPVFVALFAAVALITALMAAEPDRWSRFFTLAASIDERGAQNPCMAALLRDATGTSIGSIWSGPAMIPYAASSLAILFVTWCAIRKTDLEGRKGRTHAVFLAVLAYALVAPRFKGYSYMLLAPAAAQVLAKGGVYKTIKYIFLCFGLMPFMPFSESLPGLVGYLPAFWAAFFWGVLVIWPDKGAERGLEENEIPSEAAVGG